MLRGVYENYWTGTVAYEALKTYINMDYKGLKSAIVRLLAGERCKVDVETFENDMTSFKCMDDVLTILIHLGYLGMMLRIKRSIFRIWKYKALLPGQS